uniref:Uncharacterized protein n=1 Tax=Iridovirus sp. TaxID=135728 RepID=A0AAU7YBB7_9VIRU
MVKYHQTTLSYYSLEFLNLLFLIQHLYGYLCLYILMYHYVLF